MFKKRKGKEIYLSFLVSRGTVMIMFRLKFYLYLFLRRNTIKVRKSLRIYIYIVIVKIWMIENDHVFIGYKKKKKRKKERSERHFIKHRAKFRQF